MAIIWKDQDCAALKNYYSAEFKLEEPKILYQFRIRKSVTEPMFAVVKEGSKALDNIKAGDVVSMRFYSQDRTVPAEFRDTRIKYITKDNTTGFKNHYIVGLDIEFDQNLSVA